MWTKPSSEQSLAVALVFLLEAGAAYLVQAG